MTYEAGGAAGMRVTINTIVNTNNGRVTQRLTNVLSPDWRTIAVIYLRDDGRGNTTGVTFATYKRMP